MQNGTGYTPLSAAQVLGYGRLTVDCTTPLGTRSRPLDETEAGTQVSATGTITRVSLNGTDDAPYAWVVLTSKSTGTYATVRVSTDHYLQLFGDLVEETEVEIRGTTAQPFAEWPPLIEAASVRALATV